MNKFTKIIYLSIVFTLVFSSVSIPVFANGFHYKQDFIDGLDEWNTSWVQLQSPARESEDSSQNRFPAITSKNNDPRSIGTRPHEGVDLDMDVGEQVYPIYGGNVTEILDWTISVQIDQDTWGIFMHVTPLVSEGAVSIDEPIAEIASSANNGGYAVHLHWGVTDREITNTAYIPIYHATGPRYLSYSDWFYGMDLDHIGKPTYISSDNTIWVHSYTWDDGYLQEHEKVEFWYQTSTGNWSYANMEPVYTKTDPMTGKSQYYRWRIDLDQIAPSATSIKWYAVGYRDKNNPDHDTYNESIEPHNWGFFPSKWSHSDVVDGDNFPSGYPPAYVDQSL